MYRVVLADDEPWVLYGLRNLIGWGQEGFTVVGEAVDGLHVLELLRLKDPDVLITDIRMPGLDGIELVRKMRDDGARARVIFISGYAEFHYAQEAVRLGAFDYLLKPVDGEALLRTLRRLSAAVAQASNNNAQAADVLFLETLFASIEANDAEEVAATLARRGITKGMAFYGAIALQTSSEQCCAAVQRMLDASVVGNVALHMPYQRHAYLYGAERSVVQQLCEEIAAATEREELSAGLSEGTGGLLCLQRLHAEARIAMMGSFTCPTRNVHVYRERTAHRDLVQTMADLSVAVQGGDAVAVRGRIRRIGDICFEERLNIREVAEIHNQAASILSSSGGREAAGSLHIEYNDLSRIYRDMDDMVAQLQALAEPLPRSDSFLTRSLVRDIVARIDETFAHDIRLGSIARDFNISLGHLSNLLKRELGITFLEYITKKRLDLARTLLCDERLSIADVAEAAGYKDYFHFIKVFKKHVGISPSKYRRGCTPLTDETSGRRDPGQAPVPNDQ